MVSHAPPKHPKPENALSTENDVHAHFTLTLLYYADTHCALGNLRLKRAVQTAPMPRF